MASVETGGDDCLVAVAVAVAAAAGVFSVILVGSKSKNAKAIRGYCHYVGPVCCYSLPLRNIARGKVRRQLRTDDQRRRRAQGWAVGTSKYCTYYLPDAGPL